MASGKPVFLSYSSTDRERARELHERLARDGFDVFLDQEDLVAGQSWSEDLDAALHACKVLVLCATNRSISSRMVAKELKLADERDKAIIPVFLQNLDADVQSKISWQTAGQQGVFLFGPDKEVAYQKLVKGLDAAGVPRGSAVEVQTEERSALQRIAPLMGFGVLAATLAAWAYFNVISTLDKGGAQVAAVLGLVLLAPMARYVMRARSQHETESIVDAYKNSFRALLSTRALVTLLVATLLLGSFLTSIEVQASAKGNTVSIVAEGATDTDEERIPLGPNETKRVLKFALPFTRFMAFEDGKALDDATTRALPIFGGSIELTFEPTVFVRIPASEKRYLPDGSHVKLFARAGAEGKVQDLGTWPTDGKLAVRFGPRAGLSESQKSTRQDDSSGPEDLVDWRDARACSFEDERAVDVAQGARERYAAPGTELRAQFFAPDDSLHTETGFFPSDGQGGVADLLASSLAPWPTILVGVPQGSLASYAGNMEKGKFHVSVSAPGGDPELLEPIPSAGARLLLLGRWRPIPEEYTEEYASNSDPVKTPERRIPIGSTVEVHLRLDGNAKNLGSAHIDVVGETEPPIDLEEQKL